MSVPIPKAPRARRAQCRECGRQIDLVIDGDGAITKVDTEIRSAIAWPNGAAVQHVRLLHAGVCGIAARAERHKGGKRK